MTCSKDAVYDLMLLFPMKESVSPHAPLWVKKMFILILSKLLLLGGKTKLNYSRVKYLKNDLIGKMDKLTFF